MKTLNKDGLEARFKYSAYKKEATITAIKPFKVLAYTYNRCLKIIIPGQPMVDSRPRGKKNDSAISFYNPHKAILMKIFKEIYKDSEVLQNTFITGPMYIKMIAYDSMPKVWQKKLNSKEKQLLMQEKLVNISDPDVDNYQKVHYDVMQDPEYAIFLDDEAIVDCNTHKIFVPEDKDKRMEVYIYYNTTLPSWYKY